MGLRLSEARLPFGETTALVRRAEERGRSFELVVYDHEGHGFVLLENRLDSIRRTADFFDKHLAKVAVPA